MKLHEFLTNPGLQRPAPTKLVHFKALGLDAQHNRTLVDVHAVFVFVDEEDRGEEIQDAELALRKTYGKTPPARFVDETAWRTLHLALRDAEDPRQPFAQSVAELRKAMARPVAEELFEQYTQWLTEEFPPFVTKEEFNEMVEEAKKNSLADLLSSGESEKILRALPFLAAHFGEFPIQTSSAGEPA